MKYINPRNPGSALLIVSLAIFACSRAALQAPSAPAAATADPLVSRKVLAAAPSQPALAGAATPAQAPAIICQATFEPPPSGSPVPRGYAPECGYLMFPENRAR